MLKQLRDAVVAGEQSKRQGRSKSLLDNFKSRDSTLRSRPDSQGSRLRMESTLLSPSKQMLRAQSRVREASTELAVSPSTVGMINSPSTNNVHQAGGTRAKILQRLLLKYSSRFGASEETIRVI